MAIPPSALRVLVKLPVEAEWKHLGLELGVPPHTLNKIQFNNANRPDLAQQCLTDTFSWWLKNDPDATYERLACGLRNIGNARLAAQLSEQQHGEKIDTNYLCPLHVWFA